MPAEASFCVQSDLIDEMDVYNMASAAWQEIANIGGSEELEHEPLMVLIHCGEDLMIASYLAKRSGNEKHLKRIVSKLIDLNRDAWPDAMKTRELFDGEVAKNWFSHCTVFGTRQAG